jgi:hypothetical protein
MGKGGQITVRANGKTISEGRLARSIPVQFSLGEGLDVGMDIGSPIDFTYKAPFAFTGRIEKAKIGLGPPQTRPVVAAKRCARNSNLAIAPGATRRTCHP